MKILFYVQRLDTAHLTQQFATFLQAELPGVSFAAVTYRENPEKRYLQESQLFPELISESDIHRQAERSQANPQSLARLEREYGIPTLWQYVTQNRFLTMRQFGYLYKEGSRYSREQQLVHTQLRFEMLEAFVDRVQPDIVVYPEVDVGPSSALILERIAKKRGIPVLVPISTRLGSFHTLTDTVYSEISHAARRFQQYLQTSDWDSKSAAEVLTQFREGCLPLSYIQAELGKGERDLPFRVLLRALQKRIGHHYFRSEDPFRVSLLEADVMRLIVFYRRQRLKLSGLFKPPIAGDKYVFFPLHFEPELALILYAPFYTQQLAIIRNVAQGLPHDTTLYVKDHVVGIGTRQHGFYQQLAGIPNVRLIHSQTSALELIRGSQGVVTITGTAGMEAMLLGKPVITLGDAFYNMVDELVMHSHSFEELPYLVRKFEDFQTSEETILAFVAALLADCMPVDPLVLAFAAAKADVSDTEAFQRYARFYLKAIRERLQGTQGTLQAAELFMKTQAGQITFGSYKQRP